MTMVDEIHTVTAAQGSDEIATIRGMLNDGDTPESLRTALGDALWDMDREAVLTAFDEAFDQCETIPGEGACGESKVGHVTIRITRTIE